MQARHESTEVTIVGRILKCAVCGHTAFWERRAQLNTPVLTFFSLDWLNKSATCMVCERCGYIHWFLPMDAQENKEPAVPGQPAEP